MRRKRKAPDESVVSGTGYDVILVLVGGVG